MGQAWRCLVQGHLPRCGRWCKGQYVAKETYSWPRRLQGLLACPVALHHVPVPQTQVDVEDVKSRSGEHFPTVPSALHTREHSCHHLPIDRAQLFLDEVSAKDRRGTLKQVEGPQECFLIRRWCRERPAGGGFAEPWNSQASHYNVIADHFGCVCGASSARERFDGLVLVSSVDL